MHQTSSLFPICFYFKTERGRKTSSVSANLPQATEKKKKRLHSKGTHFLFENEMPWKQHGAEIGSQTLLFSVLFGCFFFSCIFSQVFMCSVCHCAMNEQNVWEFQRKGCFVSLRVKEEKKTTSCFWFWKIKHWQIVLESLSKAAQVIFRASGCIFEKVGDLKIGVIGVTSCGKASSRNDRLLSDSPSARNADILAHI